MGVENLVLVPLPTLKWWYELIDLNPADLIPRMRKYIEDAEKMGVTKEEAYKEVMNSLDKTNNYNTPNAVTYIIDKLIACGIHPNAIKNAFRETKADVDRTNEASK